MKRAVGYIRVSGMGAIDGDGPKRQKRSILTFAITNDVLVERNFFDEGISGTTSANDRPAFIEMLEYMGRHVIDTIIVEDMSRFARSFAVTEEALRALTMLGYILYSAQTGENVTEAYAADPMRKAMVQIQAVFAELDKNLIVEKLRKARQAIRDSGTKCEGAKAFGEECQQEKDIVTEIMKQSNAGRSLTGMAGWLNKHHFRTRRGSRWTPVQVSRVIKRYR